MLDRKAQERIDSKWKVAPFQRLLWIIAVLPSLSAGRKLALLKIDNDKPIN